jgi:hypothetical protein
MKKRTYRDDQIAKVFSAYFSGVPVDILHLGEIRAAIAQTLNLPPEEAHQAMEALVAKYRAG